MGLAAQNSNVVSAYNDMKDSNLRRSGRVHRTRHHQRGQDHGEGEDLAVPGDIYRLIAFGEDAALKQQFPDAMDRASRAT